MPWAWLHATKDYLEMAQHFERHPAMRGTINLVPSLLQQLEEYLSGEVFDPTVELMSKPAESLTAPEKELMLDSFFHAHPERMIERSVRYRELFELQKGPGRERRFTEQEYRDLAVHYSLAWTGEIARGREPFKSLIAKDRGFTEAEKKALAKAQRENVSKIVSLHKELWERGQIELTTTPYYHPILPLLIDSESAREAMPAITLPTNHIAAPTEAEVQLEKGIQFFESIFENPPSGMWPSEGSISNEALSLIRKNGIRWTASDESVLAQSLEGRKAPCGDRIIDPEYARFFPWRIETPEGELAVFFRDHGLSDDIGFRYSSWNAEEAVQHFVNNVLQIRSGLIDSYGEAILEHACISVILDGENCWEYYEHNGFYFLDQLYHLLTHTPEIRPVTFSEALGPSELKKLPLLPQVKAGSWIDANFHIWIGHSEDNLAWDYLYQATVALEQERTQAMALSGHDREAVLKRIEAAHKELMIAEGSDWCWWYGDEHFSLQKDLFDELYRMHLREVYRKLGRGIPEELSIPIWGRFSDKADIEGKKYSAMHPTATFSE